MSGASAVVRAATCRAGWVSLLALSLSLPALAGEAPSDECLDGAERARYADVEAARAGKLAFSPSALWLPPFFMTDAERSYAWVGLLYFQMKDFEAGTKTRLLPPVFFSHCRPGGRTLVTPFYGFRSDAEGVAGFTLSYFWRRDRDRETDVLFPFYWSFRERKGEGTTWSRGAGAVPPFAFWSREASGDFYTHLPPLFWQWGDSTRSTTIAGPIFHRRDEAGWLAGAVPLWLGGERDGWRFDLVPPLLLYLSSGEGQRSFFALNTYFQSREDGFSFFSFPFAFAGREGPRHHLLIPPALLWHDGDGESERTLVANTYFRKGPRGFSFSFFPLVFAAREEDRHHTVVPPLFFRWGDARETTTIAGNVYWSSSESSHHLGVVPFYFRGEHPDGFYELVPPLLWRWGDAAETNTIAGNVYYFTGPDRYELGVVPFFFSGRDGPSHHLSIPPLVWSWGDAASSHLIVGPYFHEVEPRGFHSGVVPFWFGGERDGRRYDFIPPLLLYRSAGDRDSTLWALNTYLQRRQDGFTLASVPFAFVHREGKRHFWLIPPALTWHDGDGETERTLVANTYLRTDPRGFGFSFFPLVFAAREGEAHHTFVPPLFWRWGDARGATTLLGNAYFSSRADGWDAGFLPLYAGGRRGEAYYDVVFPLFARWGDGLSSSRALFVPGYFQREPGEWHAGVFPFWFGGRRGEVRYDLIPPLALFRRKDPDELSLFALNTWYWSRSDGDFHLASVPFAFAHREGRRHSLLIPPALTYHAGDGETETTLIANTYYQSRADGFTLASVPFLFAGRDGARHHTLVPPLFWRWGDAETTTTVAANVFWSTSPEGVHRGVLPFYFAGRHGERYYDFVPPLFFRWGDSDSRTFIAGPAFHHRGRLGWFSGALPFWVGRGTGTRRLDVVPPLLAFRLRDPEQTSFFALQTYYQARRSGFTLASFPFLFAGREGEARHLVVPPLFWSFSDPEGWSAAALPFWAGGERGDRRFTLVPPLLFYRSVDAEQSTLFALQTYYQSRPDGFSLASVPFLFLGRSGDRYHTVIPPLFWSFGDSEVRHVLLAPLFDYRATRTERRFLSPLFVHSEDEQRQRTVLLGLYWRFRGPDTDAQVLLPFWWDFRSPASGTRLSTFFPVFWRYERPGETTFVFLNTMYSTGHTARGRSWSFHFFPLFDLASYNPDHFLWQVFAGLFGHERQGELTRMRLGYVWTEPTRSAHP